MTGRAPVAHDVAGAGEHAVLDERIVVVDDAADPEVDAAELVALAAAVLDAEAVSADLELCLGLVDVERIARLNAEHLGGAGEPTDVLAFPIDTEVADGVPGLLGDVIICPEVARRQAGSNAGCRVGHDGTFSAEMALLVIHGVLHLLGHDHHGDADAAAMRALEERHLGEHVARRSSP